MEDLAGHIARLQMDRNVPDDRRRGKVAVNDLPGAECTSSSGPFQCIAFPLAEFGRGFGAVGLRLDDAVGKIAALATPPVAPCADVMFLDLETCGFSGSPLFLVGLARRVKDGWLLEQLFARNYGEEAAVLDALSMRLARAGSLATFNGKSFDWPFVLDRLARHRLASPPQLPHYDLLHIARRRWAGRFANFKLQTLEEQICRRRRVADLGGREVAAAYHEYVRTGMARDVKRILQHNALDVVTMLELTVHLSDAAADSPAA